MHLNILQVKLLITKVSFSKLKDNLKGFYRSSYFDTLTNTTKTIATTQFESTHARRAFPCLDEPSLKAKFIVSLGRLKSMLTLSNTVVKNTTALADGNVLDTYEPTVTMSPYLLAFIVSEFGSTHVRGHQNFRLWGPKDRLRDLAYAAKIGPRILQHFEKVFDIKFPLRKMDMVAIPDFKSGAMENWGLITYRDTAIYYNKKNYAESNRFEYFFLRERRELSRELKI